jgi:hypothetical protein
MTERKEALRELKRVLKVYPGIPQLWSLLSRFEGALGHSESSWSALGRAMALAPENQLFRALGLVTAVRALPRAELDSYLRQERQKLRSAPAEVCAMYAFAEIHVALHERPRNTARWSRALEAVEMAFPRTRSEDLRKTLSALRLFLEHKVARRKEDPDDILYSVGLGRLAATRSGSFIDALREDAQARLYNMETSGRAA